MRAIGTTPPRHRPPDRRLLAVVLISVGMLGIILLIHGATVQHAAHPSAHQPTAPSPCAPPSTTAHAPVDLPMATDIVIIQVHTDPSGTLIVACSPDTLTQVVAHVQQGWGARGWQPVTNLPQQGATSLAFVRNGVVVLVRISALPTSPPAQRIIVTELRH